MIKKIKAHPFSFGLGLISLAIGITLFFIDAEKLMNFIYIFFGIIIIFNGLMILLDFRKIDLLSKIYGMLYIGFGILLCLYHHYIVTIIAAIALIIFPIYRIIIVPSHKDQFIKEIPHFVLAVLVLFAGFENVFVKSVGVALLLLGIFLIFSCFLYKKKLSLREKQEAIDVSYEERDLK